MRNVILYSACLAALAGAPLASAQPAAKTPPPKVESPRIQTTADANKENLEGVVTAPLRDLNVTRTNIPPVLIDAMADPYKRPATKRCQELNALLLPLNEALGTDLDTPETSDADLLDKGRDGAMGLAATVASSAVPFRGVVRRISGADKHDRTVQAAIVAGAVRRAYLKGLGEARGCAPPAVPSHQLTAQRQAEARAAARPTPPAQQPSQNPRAAPLKPKYPTR